MFAFEGTRVKMQILADRLQSRRLADRHGGFVKFGQVFLTGCIRLHSAGIPNPQGIDRS
jgi:hypothetical protein